MTLLALWPFDIDLSLQPSDSLIPHSSFIITSAMLLRLLFCLSVLAAACGSPRQFRNLQPDEKAALKQYRRLLPHRDNSDYVLLMTTHGNMVLRLYNETPLHRDNFMAKVRTGFNDSLLFHRVRNHFMIQDGDPGS
jgi:peptidyl-prolyl cis-trans isomerase B (cyclophilin B)